MEDKYIEKIQEIADRSKSNTKRLDEHDKIVKNIFNNGKDELSNGKS